MCISIRCRETHPQDIQSSGLSPNLRLTSYIERFLLLGLKARKINVVMQLYRYMVWNIVIVNWMRNHSTISFLGLWEQIHNPNFKPIEFDRFKAESSDNAFTLTPQQWRSEKRIGGKTPNIRDFASAEELVVLINLEDTNADLIRQGVPKIERLKTLREKACRQLEILKKNQDTIEALKKNLIEDTDKTD